MFQQHTVVVGRGGICEEEIAVPIPLPIPFTTSRSRMPYPQLILSGLVSGIFLLSNFHAHLSDCFPYGEGDAKKKTYLVLGSMVAFHVGLLIIFKF